MRGRFDFCWVVIGNKLSWWAAKIIYSEAQVGASQLYKADMFMSLSEMNQNALPSES